MKQFPGFKKINRGNIVIFKYPYNETQNYVKRVIGLPGDRIEIRDKTVFVNGTALNEPYTRYRENYPRPDLIFLFWVTIATNPAIHVTGAFFRLKMFLGRRYSPFGAMICRNIKSAIKKCLKLLNKQYVTLKNLFKSRSVV